MSAPPPSIGILLAGGRSRRFGGGDKCLLPLAGKPLIAWTIERLRPQVDRLVLNANGNPCRFEALGLPVLADTAAPEVGDFAGPLAGILAGMDFAKARAPEAKFIVTAATDTPFLPLNLVARLKAAAAGERPAVAKSASGLHPVFGLWPVTLAEGLRADLEAGQRKVHDWVRAQAAIEVEFAPETALAVDPFFNINRPEDLANAEALLAPD